MHHNPLGFFEKKGHHFWRIKGKNAGFFYSISKQGTKVFFGGGGGGGGVGVGDKDRVLKGIKQIGINREHRKTSGEEGGGGGGG